MLSQYKSLFHQLKWQFDLPHIQRPFNPPHTGELVFGLKLSAFFLPIVMFFLFSPVSFIIFDNQPPHLLPPKIRTLHFSLPCLSSSTGLDSYKEVFARWEAHLRALYCKPSLLAMFFDCVNVGKKGIHEASAQLQG